MKQIGKIVIQVCCLLMALSMAFATSEQLRVDISEYVSQTVLFNPLKTGDGDWHDQYENQTYYNLTGYITVTNTNTEGAPISDIYVSFDYTGNITLPAHFAGRTGTWISNDPSSNLIVLHIPEILSGESSTWIYTINGTNIRPPLNFTSSYSDYKILAGDTLTVTDRVENVFDNVSYQAADTCIYNLNITQATVPYDFFGTIIDFVFDNSSTAGPDASNVTYTANNLTQYWNVWAGECLNKGDSTYISYDVNSPHNIPTSQDFYMINSTLSYTLNQSISRLRVIDMLAIGPANVSFEKQIWKPSDSILYGSNVTWNVTGYFTPQGNINYTLYDATFWVSRRNVGGSFTDPNTIDNDSISGEPLNISYFPNAIFNASNPWTSTSWFFNYSDIPSPIVWMDVNFSITNDGYQLINRSVTQNGNDIYIKEIYLIIGYWLEIQKNLTSVATDTYEINIYVHNKGNQVTPTDSIVTIYDFMPSGFERTSAFRFSNSSWYTSADSNSSIVGEYNGTLFQWALIPTNVFNTSFAAGPVANENTTWSVAFNVTGQGDYTLLDVFITGLDPQKVDGAGATRAVVVEEILSRVRSTEGIFAVTAAILLLLGVLL